MTALRLSLSHAVWQSSPNTYQFLTLISQPLPYLFTVLLSFHLNFLHLEHCYSTTCVSHLKCRGGTTPLRGRLAIRLGCPRHKPQLSNLGYAHSFLATLCRRRKKNLQKPQPSSRGKFWWWFSRRHQDIRSPCSQMAIIWFWNNTLIGKCDIKQRKKEGKQTIHAITFVGSLFCQVLGEWFGLDLVWETFAFFKQMHTTITPQWAHLYP